MSRQEQIRKEILLQLYASRPLALSAERLERDARKQAYDFTRNEIARELQFLIDERMVLELEPRGSTTRLYRIDALGVRQFEQVFGA
jgi:hypothetical protein